MAGGTWQTQNKVLPGVYINLTTVPRPLGVAAERGYGTFAEALSWGPVGEMITIENGDNTFNILGYSILDPQMLHVREFFKGSNRTSAPRTLYLWRLANNGTVASAEIGAMIVTALYPGVRGNDINITVSNDVDDPTKFVVTTIVDGSRQDEQTVATIGQLVANNWVTFSGMASSIPTANAGTALLGGTNGTVANTAHVDYIAAAETMRFNAIAYLGTDPLIKGMYQSFTQRLRNENGRYFSCYMADYPSADTECVVSILNGVQLLDGTTLANTDCVAWFAGASAGANNNQSLTYCRYPGAATAVPALSNTELKNALADGQIAFFEEFREVKVCDDINTLTSFTPFHGKAFSRNRVMRVLDSIANDMYMIYSRFYIGAVDNNEDGRGLLKAEIVKYLSDLQGNSAIQNFTSEDVLVEPGDAIEAVKITVCIHPVEAIAKIYMTVVID